jgi:DNA-directed RNA polymerase specialized sigma24 family protein
MIGEWFGERTPLGSRPAGGIGKLRATINFVTSTSPAADVPETGARGPTAFATTHWSLIVRAADGGTAEGRAAMAELCQIYWYPLYGFARRRGLAPADAEDLTQGFLADLLGRDAVVQANAARGRFRTFLLNSFDHYRSHERARANAAKRGGGEAVVSLDVIHAAEGRFRDEPATMESPEKVYDRKWAMSLIEVALAAVRREYAANGKAAWFDELKAALWSGRGEVAYADVARRIGSTEGAVKVAVHRLRQRFGERFRAEVAKTVVDPAEIEDEIRHLLAAVSV